MPVALIPIIAGIVEVGAGYAAFSVAAGFTLANVLAGAAMVGGAMQAVGAATGDQHLEKIGSIAGAVGAGGLAIESLASAATTGAPEALSGTGADTGSQAAQTAATEGQTVAPAASNNAAGDIAQQAAGTANLSPAEQSLIDANAAPATEAAVANPTSDAGLAGAAGSPSAPGVTPNATPNVNPSPGGGAGAFGASGADNVNTGAFNGGGGDTGSLWDKITKSVGNAWDKNPSEVMKTGAGMVQGLASYVAPSPLERAKMNELNAQKARLEWEQTQRANLNASIRGLPAGAMGPAFRGAPGAALPQPGAPQFGATPGAVAPMPMPVTGAMPPTQNGLLQGAMYG